MNSERNQCGTHLNVRVSRELEDKLEMYRELKHHKSLSHTIKFFLRLGIKSTEPLDELKENPSKKEYYRKRMTIVSKVYVFRRYH